MINILIQRDKENRIRFFSIEGHAYAAEQGYDIVCASVSVLSQTAILALDEIGKVDINFSIRDDGYLSCEIPYPIEDKVQRLKTDTILDTIMIGLKGIIEAYPEYITLHNEEV